MPCAAKRVDQSASPERLYSEIGRLKMELGWLKKSSGSVYRRAQESCSSWSRGGTVIGIVGRAELEFK